MLTQKKYINPEILKQIDEKGFSVYNYISLRELLLTVQRDYLWVISKLNIPFAIITIILWVISYASGNFWPVMSFLLIAYGLIFIYLFFRLIKVTYYYFIVADVVYTKKWLIIWKQIYYYDDDWNLDENLKKYEMIFEEYLSKPSRIQEVIEKRKEKFIQSSAKKLSDSGEKLGKMLEQMDREWAWQVALVVFASFALYVVCLYIFYYIGIFLWFIFFYIYGFIINIILFFRRNTEERIKKKTLQIDNTFLKMDTTYDLLSQKIATFTGWEVSNISGFIGNKFNDFYGYTNISLKDKNKLLKLIKDSQYKDFVDFDLLKKYLKNNFNKPVKEMIAMLENYKILTEAWIKELEQTKSTKSEFSANLESRRIMLEANLRQMEFNLEKLKKMVL